MEMLNEAIIPLLGSVGLWLIRKIAKSLLLIQEMPKKLEETAQRIEKAHHERLELIEKSQHTMLQNQQIMTEQISIALEKIAESGPRCLSK